METIKIRIESFTKEQSCSSCDRYSHSAFIKKIPKGVLPCDYDKNEKLVEVEFIVDTDKFTPVMAKEILEFFTWDYNEEADPIDEVMNKYAMSAIKIATFEGYNENGVISEFENKEGFYPLNEKTGIQLVSVSGYEFDERLLCVTIVKK